MVPALRCGVLLTGHLGIHWLSLFNTRACSKITSVFNVQDVSGVTLDIKGRAKENIRNKKSFPRSILDPLVDGSTPACPTSRTVGETSKILNQREEEKSAN
ncbi:Formin-A [Frankliniella fusca]|uniref:Formin-A n=1 Tax=Frankliniella fusca TaxID=407009 RepID=A0AAE1I4W2_9NEOP|nr:Formin-A [Frankliniella fusca]